MPGQPGGNVQQTKPVILQIRRKCNGGSHITDRVFQIPVAAEVGMSGQVITGRHIAVTFRCDLIHQRLTIFRRRKITAVEQQVGLVGHRILPRINSRSMSFKIVQRQRR